MRPVLWVFTTSALLSLEGKGQSWPDHRWDHWFFDYGYHLHFAAGGPQALPAGFLGGAQHHACLSDELTGEVLFRCDGHHVLNSLGDTMPNGQDIVPPGTAIQTLIVTVSSQVHLLVTLTATVGGSDLHYTEVDMALDGGLGDVTSNKGILLASNVQGITAFSGLSPDTTWVLALVPGATDILGFRMVANSSPVAYVAHSSISPFQWAPNWSWGKTDRGAVHTSFRAGESSIRLFRCDRMNGTLFNPVQLVLPQPLHSFEFSPSGEFLYVQLQNSSLGDPVLLQVAMNPYDSAAIALSLDTIAVDSIGSLSIGSHMQLAPDGTILSYSRFASSSPDSAFASVISQPDLPGSNCGFATDAVYVGTPPFPGYGVNILPSLWWPALPPNVTVNETRIDAFITAYPNPTEALLTVCVNGSLRPDVWKIHDTDGRKIKVLEGFSERRGTLYLGDLSQGLYVLSAWKDGYRLWSERIARQ